MMAGTASAAVSISGEIMSVMIAEDTRRIRATIVQSLHIVVFVGLVLQIRSFVILQIFAWIALVQRDFTALNAENVTVAVQEKIYVESVGDVRAV